MIDWSDRLDIRKAVTRVLGEAEEPGYVTMVGVLVHKPSIHHIPLDRLGAQSRAEARFSLSIPSITTEVQNCVAHGGVAEHISKFKAGKRLRVVGRFQYVERLVEVQAAGTEDDGPEEGQTK